MATDPSKPTISRYPHGVPAWMDLLVPDPQPAADFYAALFGWHLDERSDTGARYLVASLPGGDVAAVGTLSGTASGWTMNVKVGDLTDTERRVVSAGGQVLEPAHAAFDGGRRARFRDPAGAVFGAWQSAGHPGAQVINTAGAWNFNELHTPDLDAAGTFYSAVFGWETTTFGPDLAMVRRPGYSDVLEEFDPDLRARHAEAGVPPGFSDAIAWLARQPDADVAPFWNVTFAVDDVDEIAARTRQLGGSVTTAPYDVEGSRVAELVDPLGFPFTASRYGA